jgi:hypothetical protein
MTWQPISTAPKDGAPGTKLFNGDPMSDIKTRAGDLAADLQRDAVEPMGPSGYVFVEAKAVPVITAALLSAQNEAYERAATIAVQNAQNAFLSGSSDGQTIAFSIAAAIRSLKGE